MFVRLCFVCVLTYRWLVFDETDSADVKLIMDLHSKSDQFSFTSGAQHQNLVIMVVAGDDYYNVSSQGFSSSVANGMTLYMPGYKSMDYDSVSIRGPLGNKPPVIKLSVTGNRLNHEVETAFNGYVFHDITIDPNQPLIFDGSASFDPDGDPLDYYWQVEVFDENIFTRYEVVTDEVLSITPDSRLLENGMHIFYCVNDGFEWTTNENPCHWIDIYDHLPKLGVES